MLYYLYLVTYYHFKLNGLEGIYLPVSIVAVHKKGRISWVNPCQANILCVALNVLSALKGSGGKRIRPDSFIIIALHKD
jgi:hypothetical protein